MGGNALKNTNCVRINLSLYNTIKTIVLTKLLLYHHFIPIIEMPGKDNFGDLDLMYEYKNKIDIREIVNKNFSPNEVSSNGNVLSFSYKINDNEFFQIDLIKVSNINMAKLYYDYSDCGFIIGRIMKKINLTFGEEGLWVNYQNNKIILSNNPQEICFFLQLDYNKWKNGFNNKIEIYNWIKKCRFFDKNIFDKNNLYLKKIYEKRPYFKNFIDYIFESNNLSVLDESNNLPLLDESNNLPLLDESNNLLVLNYINIFNKQYEKEKIDYKIYINNIYKTKFSGHIFLLYIEPNKINRYKDEFKKFISINEDFNTYLIKNDIELINNQIKEFIKNNKY